MEGIVEAVEIYVGGTINGELFASEKVEANSTGEIYGDIHTKRLIVDDNAVFEGRCEMTTGEAKAKPAEEKAPAKKRKAPAKTKAAEEKTSEETEVIVEEISE